VSAVGFLNERTRSARAARAVLRYVFPEHWSFMLGEIALYSFVVLVATGVYLTLFFEPSTSPTVYRGPYAPLHGLQMTRAYASTVHLSLDVEGGLLVRQVHHWAALLFIAAIVLHLLRVFFTGAFRRPRELTWCVGVTLLALALLEGFAGYSLPDDLLSGMGLAIAYSVAMSVPIIGGWLALLVWGGEFPGAAAFEGRLFIVHVLLLPVAIATLIAVHLLLVMLLHHTQFRGPGRTERNVVGAALWPAYALRSLSLFFAVVAVLVLLGGLVQINPVWLWGPYHPYAATNGAQPDWFLGWLIGALRMTPPVELHVAGWTLLPNPVFGGVLYPGVIFGLLFAWPWLERWASGDDAPHHLLDRPRDRATRTAFGAAVLTSVGVSLVAGAADRIAFSADVAYADLLWVMRVLFLVAPIVVFALVRKLCLDLAASERSEHPRTVRAERV
jgi:ubiquinol-cytochrome c reductase cytochrome b subunit